MTHQYLLLLSILANGVAALFTDTEFRLLHSVSRFFNIGFLLIIDDDALSPGVIRAVKLSSRNNLQSTAVTPDRMESTIVRELTSNEFFTTRMMVATRKRLRLGHVLKAIKFPNRVVWVLFDEPLDALTLGRDIPINGEVLYVKWERDRLAVYELLHPGSEPVRHRLRTFGHLEYKSNHVYIPDRNGHMRHKTDFHGAHIKVGIPATVCTERANDILLTMLDCHHLDIMNIMEDKMNFRQDAIPYSGDEYEFVYPNGTYSGYFKMVLDRDVNVSIVSFVITSRRVIDFDFIWPTFVLETMMYLNKDEAARSTSLSILSPFSATVWLVLVGWILFVGGLLYVCNRHYRDPETHGRDVVYGLCHAFLKIMQLICNQGSAEIPSSIPSRIIYFVTLFGGMLLGFYYSATVSSYVTVEDTYLPFTDLEGFMENGDYKIISTTTGFSIYFMKFEMPKLRSKSWKYIVKTESQPTSLEAAMRQLCDGKSLALVEVKGTFLNIQRSKCELIEVPQPIFHQYFGFAAFKYSTFTEYFILQLRRLYEVGILQRMRHFLSKFSSVKHLHVQTDFSMVTVEQITDILFIFNVGIILSACVLMIEVLRYGKRPKRVRFRMPLRGKRKRKRVRALWPP